MRRLTKLDPQPPVATSEPEDNFVFTKTGYHPLLLVDFRVAAWSIYPVAEEVSEYVDDKTYQQWLLAAWSCLLNRGPSMLPQNAYNMVIVDDSKPYWRSEELDKHWRTFPEDSLPLAKKRPKVRHTYESLAYKGGRAEKTEQWRDVAQVGLNYIAKKRLPFFSETSYEADDFVGGAVWLKRSLQNFDSASEFEPLREREVFISTVDTDHLQLAGQGVLWCNTGPWLPRLRGEKEALDYVARRMGWKIERADQIVDVKMIDGDKSDNLPPGSPRWAIDLINQHPGHHIKDSRSWRSFVAAINAEKSNIDTRGFQKAQDFCLKKGLPVLGHRR